MNIRIATAVSALLAATSAQAIIPFSVSLESEKPGAQNSTSGFDAVGVETFDSVSTGTGNNFMSTFGGSVFRGDYKNVEVRDADQYGGAGGNTSYAVTFEQTGYSVDLSSTTPGGVTYFGFWLSALDQGNNVSFFQGGNLLFTFNAGAARTFINSLKNSKSYFGNPNKAFAGQNDHEPYAFLNFYARGGTTFDRIVFAEKPEVGGYESDNHTVGRWNRMSGTIIPPGGVPEPAAWLMLIAGFGLVGTGMRRQRVVAA